MLKQDGHTLDLLHMALAMHNLPLPPALAKTLGAIELRIGVHTGEVYAGVVGRKMPRYHLFGETVTLAQKFESQGVPKEVVVSGVTAQELQKCGCEAERWLVMKQLPDKLKVDIQDVALSMLPETHTERWLVVSRDLFATNNPAVLDGSNNLRKSQSQSSSSKNHKSQSSSSKKQYKRQSRSK